MTGLVMKIRRRTAAPADEEFLYLLHRATMREYVEDTFGEWDETWQRQYFHQRFHPDNLTVIQVEFEDSGVCDVGVYCYEVRTEELFLGVIEILPEYQRCGIGSQVMRELIELAVKHGKPVALKVLKSNRPARALYQRLGFGISGESDHHYLMVYEP